MPSLDRYEILDQIVEGDCATVYRARDHDLNRDVSITQIHAPLLNDKPHLLDRYWQDVELLAALDYPQLLKIHAALPAKGWLVTEAVRDTLPHLLGGQGINMKDLRLALDHTLHALKCMHEHGLIHGDIRPDSLWITENQSVKLGNFGIACRLPHDYKSEVRADTKFAAPEVVSDQFGPVGPPSDLYSLGFSAYKLMCGEHFEELFPKVNVYERGESEAWRRWHASWNQKAPDLNRAIEGVPLDVGRVVRRLIAKDPKQRYQSADQAIADLGVAGSAGSLVPNEQSHESPRAATAPVPMAPPRRSGRWRYIALASLGAMLLLGVPLVLLLNRMLTKPPTAASRQPPAAAANGARDASDAPREGEVVEINLEQQSFSLGEGPSRAKEVIQLRPLLDRISINGQHSDLRDLRPADRVRVQRLGDGGLREILVTRDPPQTDDGVLVAVDTSTDSLLLRTATDREVTVGVNEETQYTLNGAPAWPTMLKPRDRATVEYTKLDDALVASRVDAQRRIVLMGSLVAASGNVITVQEEQADEATLTPPVSWPLAEDCYVNLNGQAYEGDRPFTLSDLRRQDRVTIEHDVTVHGIKAFRNVTESGVVSEVDHDGGAFEIVRPDGAMSVFTVAPGCQIQLGGVDVDDLSALRPGDRVTVDRKSEDPLDREAMQVSIAPAWNPDVWGLVLCFPGSDNPELPPIRFAEADGNALSAALQLRYRVPPNQLHREQNPKRAGLERAVLEFLEEIPPESQLIVYYLGHAYLSDQRVAYLVPQGFDQAQAQRTGVSLRWLLDQVDECPASEKLVILDTAHETTSPYVAPSSAELAESLLSSPDQALCRSAFVLAGCGEGETGPKLTDQGRGLLSLAVGRGLSGDADLNRDYHVAPRELFVFLQATLPTLSNKEKQTPRLFEPAESPPRLSPAAKSAIASLVNSLDQPHDRFLARYGQARRLSPDQPDATLVYALALLNEGRNKDAERVLNDLRRYFPDTFLTYQLQAWNSFLKGNYSDGIADLEQLVRQLPRATRSSDRSDVRHALEFAGSLAAYGERIQRAYSRDALRNLLQLVGEHGESAKEAFARGYGAVLTAAKASPSPGLGQVEVGLREDGIASYVQLDVARLQDDLRAALER